MKIQTTALIFSGCDAILRLTRRQDFMEVFKTNFDHVLEGFVEFQSNSYLDINFPLSLICWISLNSALMIPFNKLTERIPIS